MFLLHILMLFLKKIENSGSLMTLKSAVLWEKENLEMCTWLERNKANSFWH